MILKKGKLLLEKQRKEVYIYTMILVVHKFRRKIVTPEMEQGIVTDYNEGMKTKDIFEKHGISRRTLYLILRRYLKEAPNAERNK